MGDLFLDEFFEKVTAGLVGPTAIGLDKEALCAREALRKLTLTPSGEVIDGKLRRIEGVPQVDIGLVVRQVINAIGNGSPYSLRGEVVHIDLLCLLTPDPPSILEVTDQFLFLRIHA